MNIDIAAKASFATFVIAVAALLLAALLVAVGPLIVLVGVGALAVVWMIAYQVFREQKQ